MKEYLNIEELSDYLSIKKSTLYAKASRKEIPHYKLGGLLRFKRTEIDLWLDSMRQLPADGKVSRLARPLDSRRTDIDSLVKKTIESVKGKGYNFIQREARPR